VLKAADKMQENTSHIVSVALYQPDIPQNLGAIMRLCACFDVALHVIEPCGFPLNDTRIRRAGMDYMQHLVWQRHSSFEVFCDWLAVQDRRLVLLTTKAEQSYTQYHFSPHDVLLFGRESAGVPEEVHARADARITIPMQTGARSLNLAMSAAIALSEAVRQLRLAPEVI
jgi:tRNA (cytidine/uridine-2'-O-)-methyltransferase